MIKKILLTELYIFALSVLVLLLQDGGVHPTLLVPAAIINMLIWHLCALVALGFYVILSLLSNGGD